MDTVSTAFLIGIGLSVIGVLGDGLVKHASLQNSFSGWQFLLLGSIIYGFSAFGWFFVMREIKLTTIGVLYGVSSIILLTLIGMLYFGEEVNSIEMIGIILGISSLIILYRFA